MDNLARIADLKKQRYFMAYLDAEKCPAWKSLIIQLGIVFRFPDYYGKNFNALDECISDLDWLEEKNYALVIVNPNLLLINENEDERNYVWSFFDRIRNEWASVPNYEGEDEFRQKADFVVIRMTEKIRLTYCELHPDNYWYQQKTKIQKSLKRLFK